MTGVHHHTQLLLVEIGSQELFLYPGRTCTMIFLISAFQEARIIGLSYYTELWRDGFLNEQIKSNQAVISPLAKRKNYEIIKIF
jgi:hypothetical protein